ncbi:pyruvate dehydrogenase E1 component subunit alpha [Thecamonas trahens ATCC 50062]|uniref:pyruvate dehydrogenase (acetyl-transferring) n=1 Tax=Thecamonas trahens ATCC 50062 TaxID=461836 RepID=A0A0L0D3W7_THETB|nr:pyruvate dehydrogenase E1 component subunit alpha [Thecamonas trahens ATCC 50062]KNC45998.1 pyruvate dehydrogenase E1 component subunit alpha [Thecamonas trahens ATCC 50062]|eukprot:XP_013762978.1 pyruvate dehydrogenase E1 component subunit alpha [Thecamonas trahens ATCC 50062]
MFALARASASAAVAAPAAARAAVRCISDAALAQELTFPITPFKCHLTDGPQVEEMTTTGAELLEFFKLAVHYRRLELVAESAYKQQLIRGFCHLHIGQEAIPIGMEAAISKADSVITAYRCHTLLKARGASDVEILAELLGREAGCSRGKGGSMHMYGPEFYGGNGIVGAQIPIGAGLALAHKHANAKAADDAKRIAVALCGDGAVPQGQVHEAFNMAALWKLPVIFCVEDNQFGMGTSVSRSNANTEFYTIGHGVIPGVQVDAMDPLAVKAAFQWARQATIDNGPTILQLKTYRYRGHSMSDPGTSYRTRDEVKEVQKSRDVIEGIRARVIDAGIADAAELKAIEKDIRKTVEAALEEAKASSELPASELITDIYVDKESQKGFVRGVSLDKSWVL